MTATNRSERGTGGASGKAGRGGAGSNPAPDVRGPERGRGPDGPVSVRVPLSLRVPNPPARFVGRADAARRARELLGRGPVTVIVGEAGSGKTALVSWLLHGALAAQAGEAAYVSLRSAEAHEDAALVVARALSRAWGARDVGWPEVLGDPDALGAVAIDLAEERWVVLDDLGFGDPAQVARLLAQLARYARRGKWIALTRSAPALEELVGHVVTLGPMPDGEMRLLLRTLDPGMGAEERAAVVAQAAGSPLLLRQILAGGVPTPRGAARLPEGAAAALRALSWIAVPLPEALLARVAPEVARELGALEQAGAVERTGEGVRAHAQVRAEAAAPASEADRAWCGEAARALCESGEPAWQIEGVRLWLLAGRGAEAERAIGEAGEALLASGYAARLWRVLEEGKEGRSGALDGWRLRAAAELGDAAVLQSVAPPSSESAEARFQWARLLLGARRLEEAKVLAAEAREKALAAGEARLAFQAGLLGARCVANQGKLREAVAMLDTVEAPDFTSAAAREAFAAMVLGIDGQGAAALARASAMAGRLHEVERAERARVGYRVAQAYNYAGHPREAAQILDGLLADAGSSVRLLVGRDVRYARACLALDGGQIEVALAALAELTPYVGRTTLLGIYLDVARAYAFFAEGSLAEAARLLGEVTARDPAAHVAAEVEVMATRLRALRRAAPAESEGAGAREVVSLFGEALGLARRSLEVRWGRAAPAEVVAEVANELVNVELRVAARTLRAEALLVGGDAAAAAGEAAAAAELARERGYGIRAAEARQVACDALVVAGQWEALGRAAGALGEMAAAMPSRRFDAAARFFRMVAAPGPLDGAVLEALATEEAAPDVALRARALLGAEVAGDAIDRAVLAAIRAAEGKRAPETLAGKVGGGEWQAGWGLDEVAQQVWLPGGARVDLSRHDALWRVLASLAACGGAATKEELVVRVWNERDYHPLRHDNRLHAAVRKLRRAIEDDPSAPARVVTTEDGYALAGVVRRLRA